MVIVLVLLVVVMAIFGHVMSSIPRFFRVIAVQLHFASLHVLG